LPSCGQHLPIQNGNLKNHLKASFYQKTFKESEGHMEWLAEEFQVLAIVDIP